MMDKKKSKSKSKREVAVLLPETYGKSCWEKWLGEKKERKRKEEKR